MNSLISNLLPVDFKYLEVKKSKQEVTEILTSIISKTSDRDFPFYGTIRKDIIQFSRRDISINTISEIVFIARITEKQDIVSIDIKSRYRVFAFIGYLFFVSILSILALSISNPLVYLIIIMPYVFCVIKIKIRSYEVLLELEMYLTSPSHY